MSEPATSALSFTSLYSLPPVAAFGGGRLTGDGGLPWLAEADTAPDLCPALAACIPE